jgi:hypothetical protein
MDCLAYISYSFPPPPRHLGGRSIHDEVHRMCHVNVVPCSAVGTSNHAHTAHTQHTRHTRDTTSTRHIWPAGRVRCSSPRTVGSGDGGSRRVTASHGGDPPAKLRV